MGGPQIQGIPASFEAAGVWKTNDSVITIRVIFRNTIAACMAGQPILDIGGLMLPHNVTSKSRILFAAEHDRRRRKVEDASDTRASRPDEAMHATV
jgi:hypothetical protein